MLHYKVYQNKSKGNKAYGKWFARATVNQTIDLDQLAEHMANHNTPYSKGAIFGVLTDMVNCIRELVLEGNAVKIPNLAIFSAGLTTTAAEAPEEFSPTKNIKSVHLRARSTGDLTRAVLTAAAKVTRADTYDPSLNTIEDETETGTETETPTDPDGKSVNP
ncbi:DNA-binding protein [Hallella mizrahii]|uniref:DNA-binding protein n=1 Tax=Hallella mizrahii TaxID=2606637 RepID=A0A7K0KJM7_9BACT|nr:DNA-binding protein [Hallella mizrahii]MST86069.1 DNA-binding protein [Hallella mizrahii]